MDRTRRPFIVAALLAATLTACGNDSSARDTSASADRTAFVLSEWSITAPTVLLAAGQVKLTATNRGSETHELVIVRTEDAASLPLRSDGSVDEEKILEAAKVGEIADVASGTSISKTLDLIAGHYLAICNLVDQMGVGEGPAGGGMGGGGMGSGGMGNGGGSGMGHVHYSLGMVTQFTVT